MKYLIRAPRSLLHRDRRSLLLMKYLIRAPRSLLLLLLLCLSACYLQTREAKTLVVQLGAPEAERRAEAAHALVAMGPGAIDALVWGISHENPQIRETAAWTLSDIATPAARVVPALISVLSDPDENVRVVGSIALQQLGEPAVPFLIDALAAESMETRLHVAYALGEIGKRFDNSATKRARLQDILAALMRSLTDPEWNVRRLVVRALVTIGSPAVPALTEALNGTDSERRMMAERALNDIGTPEARQAIAAAKKRFSAE